MKRFLIPLALFLALASFLAVGLNRDPRELPSPLVGRAAPGFELPRLAPDGARFSPADMKGKVWMLNVWASWCVSCRQEHPVLMTTVDRTWDETSERSGQTNHSWGYERRTYWDAAGSGVTTP